MYSARIFQLLFVALSMWSVAQALSIDSVPEVANAVEKRQQTSDGSAGDNTPTSATTPPPTSTTQPPTTQTTESSEPPPDSSTPSPSPTQDPTPSSSSQTSDRATITSTSSRTEPSSSQSVIEETTTEIITTTNSDGVPTTFTTESRTTRTPGLSNGNNDGGSPGMSTGTRNTIIGVVVGVGGALILGALGIMGWRIWGRKKQVEEQDNLMDNYNGGRFSSMGMDKPDVGSGPGNHNGGRNPFHQTLETYHAPTQANPSANF